MSGTVQHGAASRQGSPAALVAALFGLSGRSSLPGPALVALLTLLYPICWGVSEGGNVISPTGEMIWYGILDLLAGPFFLFFFLWGLRSIDYGAFGLASGKYTDGAYGANATGAYMAGGGSAPGTGAGIAGGPGAAAGPNMASAAPGTGVTGTRGVNGVV